MYPLRLPLKLRGKFLKKKKFPRHEETSYSGTELKQLEIEMSKLIFRDKHCKT